MIKISKNTKLGILVLVCLSILIWGINYLKGIDLLKRNTNYYIVYDKIDGLLKSSAVTINGFRVGQVSDIEFLGDYSGRLLVTLSLQENFKIAKGSTAKIFSSDIMGTKGIKLEIVHSGEYYNDDDTIPGTTEIDLKDQISAQLQPIKNKAEALITSLDSVLKVVNYVLNQKTRENLIQTVENANRTVANIESSTAELNKIMKSGKINSIVTNLDNVSGTFSKNSGQISKIINNLSSISDSLSKLNINPVFAEIGSIVKKLNSDESSIGLLINDPQLYQNLNSLAESLDLLLKDVKNNPKRYVHFSAIRTGKDVYVTARPNTPEDANQIIYKVELISSPEKLSTEAPIFKDFAPVDEIKSGKTYKYLTGESPDFNKIANLLNTARNSFPNASMVAFKNGKSIKLEKTVEKTAK